MSAKRPSPMISSGRNSSLRPGETGSGGGPAVEETSRAGGIGSPGASVSGTIPARSASCQNGANSPPPRCSLQPRQCSRTSSCGFGLVLPCRMATTSCIDRPAEKRQDLRLLDRRDAVEGARVAPGLVFVRFRDGPEACLRGLVAIKRQADRERDPRQRRRETAIGGRVVNRVRVEHQQRIDLAGLHVGGQLGERLRRGGAARRQPGRSARSWPRRPRARC